MVDKTSIQILNENLSRNGLILPTDYVVMKRNFKLELRKFYLDSLENGQTILDLNAGFEGIYKEIDLSKVEYISLQQNPNVQSFLEQQKISVKKWYIPNIPLDNNSVDYVLCTAFIEHLPTYIDALNLLIEIKRVLRPQGKILVIFPNYLSLKKIFYEDYKHGWVTTKKRLTDMLLDCHYNICGYRYTIGWITMRMNPITAIIRFAISIAMCILSLNFTERFLGMLKLDNLGTKVKKTLLEQVVIEAEVKK